MARPEGRRLRARDRRQPIKAGDNYWALLNSPLNEYVTISAAAATPAGAASANAADRRR